ncbi:MAG: hypothetical protein WBC91_14965 [Phototrophicaceae bacterium]
MMSHQKKEVILAILSLLLLFVAGGLAHLGWQFALGQLLGIVALLIGLVAVLLVPRPRQPEVLGYQPKRWTQNILKWVSAPQVEAVILLWFGISLIAQPQFSSAYRLSDSYLLTAILGWVFLLLAWRMAVQLPSPVAYTVMTSYRLLYTLIVLFSVATSDGPLIILGAYLGGILQGLLAMVVQWELRQMAQQMVGLRHEIQHLQETV